MDILNNLATNYPIVAKILEIVIVVAAVGWSLEEILRTIDRVTPKSWKWDNTIADFLVRVLRAIGKILPVTKKPNA